MPTKQYGTIYADPPWPENGGGKIKRGADRHYPTMKVKEIAMLNVGALALPNAHLYLWATNNFLAEAIQVMHLWGFTYITTITWAKVQASGKPQVGLGQYFRGATEHCLFGKRGNPPYKVVDGKRQQGSTLLLAPSGEHSEKPEAMRAMIERVSYGPFLELFARKQVEGWECWGNEVPSTTEVSTIYRTLAIPLR